MVADAQLSPSDVITQDNNMNENQAKYNYTGDKPSPQVKAHRMALKERANKEASEAHTKAVMAQKKQWDADKAKVSMNVSKKSKKVKKWTK